MLLANTFRLIIRLQLTRSDTRRLGALDDLERHALERGDQRSLRHACLMQSFLVDADADKTVRDDPDSPVYIFAHRTPRHVRAISLSSALTVSPSPSLSANAKTSAMLSPRASAQVTVSETGPPATTAACSTHFLPRNHSWAPSAQLWSSCAPRPTPCKFQLLTRRRHQARQSDRSQRNDDKKREKIREGRCSNCKASLPIAALLNSIPRWYLG